MERKGWNYRLKRVWGEVNRMIQQEFQPRKCKYCGSANVVRFGHSKQKQRLLCRDCKRTFMDTDALAGMKTPSDQVASALNMYYEGMSLNAVRRHLQQTHNNYPSDSTVYEWVIRFTKQAIEQTKDYKPEVGNVWVADETVLDIGGQKVWFWDIIDAKTRFLLASHMSTKRTTADALTLMKLAEQRAGKVPELVFTDKLQAYTDGIEIAWGADTKHIPSKGFVKPMNTNIIERFHGSLKGRTKVMRGFKSIKTAKLILDGWLVHYNFFRPHETLKGKTPAERAGLKLPFKNWMDVVTRPTAITPKVKFEIQKEPPFVKGQKIPPEIKRAIGMEAGKIPKELRGRMG
jgi:putative transposase